MRFAKHGQTGTPCYRAWHNMRMRCQNPKVKSYKDYGARGIKVCERWQCFDNFFADMGHPPAGYEIDRINNDGHYKPGNCRWVTSCENRQKKRNMVFLTAFGETKSQSQWARDLGINITTIVARLKRGWSHEEALSRGHLN